LPTEYFKHEPELKFSGSGSISSVDSNLVGISAKGKGRYTDGQVRGSPGPLISKRVAFDVSIVDPNAVSYSSAGACGESFLKQVQIPMPAAWYRLRTDHLHNEWWHGGAAPETVLEPTLSSIGWPGRRRMSR
jgi:hypothetical protein